MELKPILKFLAWVFVGYLVVVGLLTVFQNQLIFHPSTRMVDSPERLGMPWSEHWIETADGITIHGWMLGEPADNPVVVYSHGNAGNISGRIGIAADIAEQGAAVLFYDYRGYGKSEGSPSENGIYEDGEAVVHYLRHRLGVDEERMIFYGRSLGGAVAARQSSEFDGRGLVLDAAFVNGKEIASDVYPFVPQFLVSIRFPVDEDLSQTNAEHVMIMHGNRDRIIDIRHGRELYEIAKTVGSARFVELDGGHNDSFNLSRELYTQSWRDFLENM